MTFHKIGPSAVASFKEDAAVNMAYLKKHINDCSNPEFAASLCKYWEKFDRLSDAQFFRATQFWTEAKENDPEVAAGEKLPEVRDTTNVTSFQLKVDAMAVAALIEKFDAAVEKIKYPAFKFQTSEQMYLRFYRTTDRSKNGAGNIAVVQGSKSEERIPIALLVRKNNNVRWYAAALENVAIQQKVKEIVEDFINQIQINGKQHAHCCFCGLGLENKSSIYHGYGPICAGNYGLPWGDVPGEEMKIGDYL